MAETVLVFGGSGNVGVAAVVGALRAGRRVIAVVRNQASAEKMFKFVGTRNDITIVEADITSEDAVNDIVNKARVGKLPAFQHVWVSPGAAYLDTSILDLDMTTLRQCMTLSFETYVVAYRTTVPYLLEMGFPNSTFTMCTGAQGNIGLRAAPAITQGALYSFALAAARELESSNIRLNEVYLAYRVQFEVDEAAAKQWSTVPIMTSAEFAPLYEKLLDRVDIMGSRVNALTAADVSVLNTVKKF